MSAPRMGAIELREAEDGGAIQLSMYPSIFDSEYNMGDYDEIVRGGAFARTLGEGPDVILNLEHAGLALASTMPVDGEPTLKLSEQDIGLYGQAELNPDDPDAKLLRAKSTVAPLESSFAFRTTSQKWNKNYTKREILAVSLHRGDISIVGRAASPKTQGMVKMRGNGGVEERRRRAEQIGQRFFGFSGRLAEPEPPRGRSQIAVPTSLIPSGIEAARAAKARAMRSEHTPPSLDALERQRRAAKRAQAKRPMTIEAARAAKARQTRR